MSLRILQPSSFVFCPLSFVLPIYQETSYLKMGKLHLPTVMGFGDGDACHGPRAVNNKPRTTLHLQAQENDAGEDCGEGEAFSLEIVLVENCGAEDERYHHGEAPQKRTGGNRGVWYRKSVEI